MSLPRLRLVTLGLVLVGVGLPAGAGAAPAAVQTYVSGDGDDSLPCSLAAPCKTWAGAISKTAAGGTVTAVSSGGFGALTITKSITIDGAGHLASTLVTDTAGIIVNGVGIDVLLKRLNVDNTGICPPLSTSKGIRFLKGNSLTIQDVDVQGFRGAGISLEPTDGHGAVVIRDSVVVNNCIAGVLAASPAVSGDMTVRLEDNVIYGNPTGVRAGAHAAVTLTANTIVHNTTQTASEADGTLVSLGDNRIGGVAGTPGAMPAVPTADPGPAPIAAPAPPAAVVTPAVTPARRCRMPKLTNMTLAGAKAALERAHCRLGTVRYRIRRWVTPDRVYGQSLDTGRLRVANTRVSAWVSARAPRPAGARAAAIIGPLTRAWVGVTGDDANVCSRTALCRTFAHAVTQTAQNGIVDVVGDGDFGPVTIDHALTIDGRGAMASITVAAGNAITVAAGADERVTLRNLTLATAPRCTAPGSGDGIALQSGGGLHIDDVSVDGFPGSGIALAPSADGVTTIRSGSVAGNCTAGLSAQRPGGAVAAIADGMLFVTNGTGVAAGDGSLIQLTGSDVAANATGFSATGSGQIQGWPTNVFTPNGTPGFTPGTLPLS